MKKISKNNIRRSSNISSYTCELSDNCFNPYKILNQNLASIERNKGISKVSKYLFIFLKALRKLDKFYLNKDRNLYRCINCDIDLKYHYVVFKGADFNRKDGNKILHFEEGDKISVYNDRIEEGCVFADFHKN